MSTNKIQKVEKAISRKCVLNDFFGEEEDTQELSALLSSLSTSDSADSESSKEILGILSKRKGTYNSALTVSHILAPIPKKINSSILIERVSRPFESM
jgi:hypothetical protein